MFAQSAHCPATTFVKRGYTRLLLPQLVENKRTIRTGSLDNSLVGHKLYA